MPFRKKLFGEYDLVFILKEIHNTLNFFNVTKKNNNLSAKTA